MALARSIDSVGPVQAGVEPLGRIRRGFLSREHVSQFVEEGVGIRLMVEVAALPAPIGPGSGETIEYLLSRVFAYRFVAVRGFAPEELGNAFLRHRFQRGRDSGLAEIFLRQHIAGDLA